MAIDGSPGFVLAEGAGGASVSAAGAAFVGAGAQQLGAGAQHVGAGAQHDDLLRQHRAWAISEHSAKPAVQRTVAAANLNMVFLLAKDGNPRQGQTSDLEMTAEIGTSAPVAGTTGTFRLPAYRHDAVDKSRPRKSGAMRQTM
jgi:hypothetical protein